MGSVIAEKFELPATFSNHIGRNCAFDFGGSLTKVAFVENYNICNETKETDKKLIIRMEAYSHKNTIKALNYLPDASESSGPSGKFVVTGAEFRKIKDAMMQKIGKRNVELVTEFVCIKAAVRFLCGLVPLSEAFHRYDDVTVSEMTMIAKEITLSMKLMNQTQNGGYTSTDKWLASIKSFNKSYDKTTETATMKAEQELCTFNGLYPNMYPCIVASLGSACSFLMIKSKDEFELLDLNSRSGPTFVGLGSLLTGAKNFEDLITMAAKGSNTVTDTISGDLSSGDPDDPYNLFAKNILLFSFAKTQKHNLSEYRKEDLARSILVMIANDIAQSTIAYAAAYKAKYVFFGGNLASHALVRHEIMKAYSVRRTHNSAFDVQFFFLKHGGYLGAIGGLMHST